MRYQGGQYAYEVQEGWAKLPEGLQVDQVCGVAVGKADHVFVFNRGSNPVIELDPDGNFVGSWDVTLIDPHGIHADSEGNIYLADRGAHVVTMHDPDGTLVMTLGTRGKPSDTGSARHGDAVQRAAGPFNTPAGIAVAETGQIFVADGYRNARVHKFSPEGELLLSWGRPGTVGPGEFNLVHGLALDGQGRVLVCDRENHRMQVFDREGGHIATWTGFERPMGVVVDSDGTAFIPELPSRVTVVDRDGKVLDRWGGERSEEPGGLTEPHGIAMDSRGDIYVAEVTRGGRVQKFARVQNPLAR